MASRRLIALTLLSFALLLGVSGWQAWQVDQANERMLSRRLQSINRVFTPSLAEAAYVEEMARVHELLVRLTSDPAIVNATLRDETGNARDFTGSIPPPSLTSLPPTRTTWTQDGILRWVQPLQDFVGEASSRRYWLDLSLDPQRADINGMRSFSAWLPLLSLLLLIPLIFLWRQARREADGTGSADVGLSGRRNATSASFPALRGQPDADDDISYVSHELRAPLSGVLGFCRLLENSPLDAQQREWLRHIHLASNGLLDTVDHVLGDTRRGRADDAFDIAEVLWEVLCLQTPLAQSKGITLLPIVYDDVPPRLKGADVAVRQLLTNLISNAVKYASAGDVITRIVLESRSGSTVRLRISVSDSGGTDPVHRGRLYRAIERGRKQADAAEGVGIAICHRLSAEMDGWLALGSRQGKGNTVVANIGLDAYEPYVRPAEFDLEGAQIALWQPHTRLGYLLDYALKRWHARPLPLSEPGSLTTLGGETELAIVGIDESALEPHSHQLWQQRFDAMHKPCLLVVNIGPTHALSWRLPEGSVVLRLPISRYILGRTLAKMLAERRQRDLPPRPQILVVDDDEVSQHYLDALLPIIGASALVAGDAAEAVAIACERPVDLVLMDLHLPDASGFEATARLRSLDREWKAKPVIAMTAEPDAHRRHLLADHGIDEMLIKPFDESLLRSVLARYLPATIAPATAPAAATSPLPPVTEAASSERRTSEATSLSSAHASFAATASRGGDLPVVDKALALRLSGHREALAEEMMGLLIASLPEYRQTLHAAWQRQDGPALAEIVHQLGGGCRYCGVPQLSFACETLEHRCRHHSLDQCGDAFRELIAACDRLRVWADDQMITASH